MNEDLVHYGSTRTSKPPRPDMYGTFIRSKSTPRDPYRPHDHDHDHDHDHTPTKAPWLFPE